MGLSITMQDLKHIISVRASDSVSETYSNTNNTKEQTPRIKRTLGEVQRIAYQIEAKLGKCYPSRYKYFCKVAWRLPENKIWTHVEAATSPGCKTNPTQLFIWLCEQEPEMIK